MNCLTPQLTVQGFPVRTNGPSYLPRSIQTLQSVSEWQYAPFDSAQGPPADLWLRMEIAIAFKQFLCMKLAKPPVAEEIPFTAESWLVAIAEGMAEELDRERIKQGFKQLYRPLKWWPQPAELLNVLPRRKTPPPQPSPSWGGSEPLPPAGGGREGGDVAAEALDKILESLT